MILDIGAMPYRKAMAVLRFCCENDIDKENAQRLLNEISSKMTEEEISWNITVPESFATYLELKWG